MCQLYKFLNGLKQVSRAWYTRLSDFLLSISFCVFKVGTLLFILIQLLSSEFKLCDLGIVQFFLGIEILSIGMGLMLWQYKYTLDIFTRAGMISCKLVDTLISTSKFIILSDPLFSDPTRFRQIMSAPQYLTFTRPDICFDVNIVFQFMYALDSH